MLLFQLLDRHNFHLWQLHPGAAINLNVFCDIRVDGKAWGRSPMPRPRSIPAGSHRVVCRNPVTGKKYDQTIQVRSGQLRRLRHSLLARTRVTVRLTRSTSILIGSVAYRPGSTKMIPGRYRYELLKGSKVVARGWISIPPGRCTLVDSPKPVCR